MALSAAANLWGSYCRIVEKLCRSIHLQAQQRQPSKGRNTQVTKAIASVAVEATLQAGAEVEMAPPHESVDPADTSHLVDPPS